MAQLDYAGYLYIDAMTPVPLMYPEASHCTTSQVRNPAAGRGQHQAVDAVIAGLQS